jgi:hypothetical protein
MTRPTVDMSLSLDIRTFVRLGWWNPYQTLRYGCSWSQHGQKIGSIDWVAYPDSILLLYATTDSSGQRTLRDDLVPVLRDVDRLGRRRVWFICPGCAQRVHTLHAPGTAGAIWFRCRTCHGLSYNSRNEYTPLLGQLINHLKRLERGGKTIGQQRLDELVQKTEAANTRVNHQVQKYSEQRSHKRILILPPGRPSKKMARVVAAWYRAQEPPSPAPVLRAPGRPRTKRAYVRHQPLNVRPPSSDHEAFCVRCRDRRPLKRPRTVTLRNGRPALRGNCAVCGTQLCRLLPAPRRSS